MSGKSIVNERIHIGKLPVDVVDFEGALDTIDALVQKGEGGTVYTPNVDHIVMGEHDARFRDAYNATSLSLVDGTPVLWASRLLGKPLPAKISGSDLVMPLMERAAERGYRVYFLGGAPGVAQLAKQKLEQALPGIQIVGIDEGRVDVSGPLTESDEIVERIRAARPHLVLVALGAPKQEIWSEARRKLVQPAVLIGVGASLDFVAGTQKRAPRWMSKVGAEWLFRMAQEPRRLAARYLLRDPEFCVILLRQLLSS